MRLIQIILVIDSLILLVSTIASAGIYNKKVRYPETHRPYLFYHRDYAWIGLNGK